MRERRLRAAEILDRLAVEHPDAHIALNWSTPLDLLVATILSAQSTDVGVNRVTATLFRQFRVPEDYLSVPAGDLQQLIKPTGFFRQKTAAIRGCCLAILERHGGEVPQTTAELVALPGVGRKTAAVVASNAFGRARGDRGRHARAPALPPPRADPAHRPGQDRAGADAALSA